MNSIIKEYYPVFELYQSLRTQLLDILADEDLAYCPNSQTETLAELCREIGETEVAYIEAFKTFKQEFSYRHEAITSIQLANEQTTTPTILPSCTLAAT